MVRKLDPVTQRDVIARLNLIQKLGRQEYQTLWKPRLTDNLLLRRKIYVYLYLTTAAQALKWPRLSDSASWRLPHTTVQVRRTNERLKHVGHRITN